MAGTSPEIGDRWDGRHDAVALLLRLIGVGVFGYALIRTGAFSGTAWVAAGTAAALVLLLGLLVLRALRPFGPLAVVLASIVMVLGIVLNPEIDFLGSVFFVVAGIALVGQPEVPLRTGLTIAGVLSVGLVARAVLADPQWTVLLSNLFGAVAVLLLGINRRQRVLRLRETARASDLERRGRIASDLHDVLAHSLGGLVVQLDAAGAELERGRTDAAAARLRTSRQLAVDGLRDARAAVEQLRSGAAPRTASGPARLSGNHSADLAADLTADLMPALRAVLHGPVGLSLGVELEVVGEERPVPVGVVEPLVAAARESLTNINKHSPGARVSATLVYAPQSVRLEVVNALPPADQAAGDLAETGGGLGLTGLRERVEAAGGRFQARPEGRRWVLGVELPTVVAAKAARGAGRGGAR